MSAELLPMLARGADANNDILSGAKWYFYASGTTTPQSVYTTSALSVAHSNPVVADGGGKFAPIYMDSSLSYRGVLKSADDATTIFDIDPINAGALLQLGSSASGKGASLIAVHDSQWGDDNLQEVVDTLENTLGKRTSLIDGLVPGAVSALQAASNTTLIQAAIDALEAAGGGALIVDDIYQHSGTLTMRNAVYLRGFGKYHSGLTYTGTTLQIDGQGGGSGDRVIFSISDMHLTWDGSSGTPGCMKLAWNQRSLPITMGLKISNFPDFAIRYTGDNWLITHVFDEIVECATDASSAGAISRVTDAINLADIKLIGVVIEACGHSAATAGGINMVGNATYQTQGLWLIGCTIEGNLGTYEMYVEYADSVNIASSYFETGSGTGKKGVGLSNCYASITQTRLGSGPGNTGGQAIEALSSSNVHIAGNLYDSDFGDCDVSINNSLVSGSDYTGLIRVKQTGTGQWSTPTIYASGRINGTSATVASGAMNISSVTRNSAGNYTVTFSRALPSSNYVVQVSARDSGTGVLPAAFQVVNATGCTIYTGNPLADADYIGFTVIGNPVA
jgi:hypothetical protein